MTWGEFKRWVEERGVTDETPVHYIDFSWEPVGLDVEETGAFNVW